MTRYASYQVCDQVAQAGLGKIALLGIYGTDILVPQVPFTFEQLFFVVRFRSTIDDLPSRLVVRIERPGQEPFTVDQSDALPKSSPRADATFFDAQAIVRLAPFHIETEGTVKVFVDDERGVNYAGGLRVLIGVHPEASLPRLAHSAILAVGHFERLKNEKTPFTEQAAVELMNSLAKLVKSSGLATQLPYPDADMRLLLDNQHIHVFFPQPIEDDFAFVQIEPSAAFDSAVIEHIDKLGFVARFEPNAPQDANFEYTVSRPAKSEEARTKRPRIKPTKKQ